MKLTSRVLCSISSRRINIYKRKEKLTEKAEP
jgi:hypothetical protein